MGLLINIMTVSWICCLLFRTKNNDHCGCILPNNVVDIAMCYINIRFAQSTTQTLIGGELKPTLAFIDVSAGWRCRVNIPMARLTLGRFVVRNFYGNLFGVRVYMP